MAFLGGAECSTAGNPLSQFTKHVQDDKSLQRDRLAGRGPATPLESMRSQAHAAGQHDNAMNEFLQQQGPMQGPFAMEQLRRELPTFVPGPQVARTGSPAWAAEFDPGEQARMEAAFKGPHAQGFDAAEFQRFQQMNQSRSARMSPTPMESFTQQTPLRYAGGMGMGLGMGMGMGLGSMYQPQMGLQRPMNTTTTAEGKGKERMVELDDQNWEEQFAEIDAAGQSSQLDEEANSAIERELNDIERSVESESHYDGDFESVWRGIQAERAENRQLGEDDFDVNGQLGDFDPWEGFETMQNHSAFRDPQLGEYIFEEENIFSNIADPFGEGMKIMQEGGNLSLAALAFEAAVQKDPKHVEAWNMLGSAQAQNEKETPAIRALEQALKLDPNNLEALMGLAVSYTNEGYDATAYRTLERWLSVKYPQVISPNDLSSPADVGFTDRHQLHQRVTELFIKAAQLSPDGEQMDPDVQVGLGVLFYGDESYNKAVDCFSAALASTQAGSTNDSSQVHLLWNRLGATLANSGRSEEAIAAYERALTAKPGFVRARYNLGVSCINIGCLDQAAQHLLGALAMHDVVAREGRERVQEVMGGSGSGAGAASQADLEQLMSANQSTNLYETLRRVLILMDRRDLAEMAYPGMDIDVFRKEFDF